MFPCGRNVFIIDVLAEVVCGQQSKLTTWRIHQSCNYGFKDRNPGVGCGNLASSHNGMQDIELHVIPDRVWEVNEV